MQKDELLIVSGFGRCGTSLVMQMLHAAGVRCVGAYPAFEDSWTTQTRNSAEWLAHASGRAIKLLDPHRHMPPPNLPARGIWLDRNPRQQAKSIAKFGNLMQGLPGGRRMVRGYEKGLVRDRGPAMKAHLCACAVDWLALKFEDIIQEPVKVAYLIAKVAGLPDDAGRIELMAQVVRPRGIDCYDGLLEVDLLDGSASALSSLTAGVPL